MARRNLLAEAQVTAAAQVAPQIAALGEALQQARADRNSAIHAAAAANAGIAHAIHLAGSSVKKGYRGAQALAAPGQSYSNSQYGAAAGAERSLGTTALASSLANSLKELSDRRISAAAGRAYATQRALGDYEGKVAGVQSKRQSLAAQQGLLTGAAYSKLSESQADRNLRLSLQRESESFTAGQNRLGRKQDRILTNRKITADAIATENAQEFTAGQNAKNRRAARRNTVYSQNQQNKRARLAARGTGGGGPKPSADHVYKGRTSIELIRGEYAKGGSMHTVAEDARKKGYPEPIINAAADLHTKGHISPQGVRKLEQLGYTVPKEWTGIQVRPHTRRRKGQ